MSLPQPILDMLQEADDAKQISDAAAGRVKVAQADADAAAAALSDEKSNAAAVKADLQAKVNAAVKALQDYFAGIMVMPPAETRKPAPARPTPARPH